jgi:hypothetical protein
MSLSTVIATSRHADAEVLVEAGILGRDDRVAQTRGDLVVTNDDTALVANSATVWPSRARMRVMVLGR